MKSRIRPPLNLSSSDVRVRTKSRSTSDDQAAASSDDMVEAPQGDDDLGIPSTDTQSEEPQTAPQAPEFVAETVAEAKPEPLTITPPPETQAPVPRPETERAPTRKRSKRDLSELTPAAARPDAVMRVSSASGPLFWSAVIFISLLWALSLTAFVLGAETDLNAFVNAPFRLVILGALALFPIGMIVATAFALRHAAILSRESRRAAALADAMVAPAAMAANQTEALVDSLRQQIEQAVRAVRVAHNDLSDLSSRMKSETEAMLDAADRARQSTATITGALSHEREAVTRMGEALDIQAMGVIDSVDRQARMVADASDLAQTQLREAEAALAARAADLATTASDAHDTARAIAEDLGRQTLRLETAGAGVADQIRSVEEGLSQQRAGLVSAALSLRADQEDFAVHLENQRAQLTDALTVTRTATVELGETSSRGVDILRDLVLHAQEQFRQVLNGAENERTSFETRIHSTLSNISVMAADARDELVGETRRALEQLNIAAEDARRAADAAATTAQGRVDRLNESLFDAGKKADEAFDSRFMAARRLIEDSADLINEAGDKAAERLDESFAHARKGIQQVDAALNELNARADELPLQAKSRLEEIRRAVEDGLTAMTEAARKAAHETEAVDQAFQDRVKRNYEMLTEAVRLMGVISAQPLPTAPMPSPNPYVERFDRPREAPRALAPERAPERTPERAPDRSRDRPATSGRPREPLETPPVARPSRTTRPTVSTPEGWSWRDLLGGMDGRAADGTTPEPAPVSATPEAFGHLDDLMVSEVAAMGVDAAALLNRARVEETIAAILADDNEGARLVIRRIAPAAIRRLSRRLTTDPTLREQTQAFVSDYDRQINIALLTRDPHTALHDILSSNAGRTYLLFDAAISDLI